MPEIEYEPMSAKEELELLNDMLFDVVMFDDGSEKVDAFPEVPDPDLESVEMDDDEIKALFTEAYGPEFKAVDTDPDPSQKPGAVRLRRYWTRGPGAAKIRWGTPGDFNRCVRQMRKYVGTGAEGICNVYHRSAVGAPPGQGHKVIPILERAWAIEETVEQKRQVSAEEREELAKRGAAMPDGSYPIASEQDLRNAIHAFGRAKNKEAVRQHIIKRAKALGLTRLLPSTWDVKARAQALERKEVPVRQDGEFPGSG